MPTDFQEPVYARRKPATERRFFLAVLLGRVFKSEWAVQAAELALALALALVALTLWLAVPVLPHRLSGPPPDPLVTHP